MISNLLRRTLILALAAGSLCSGASAAQVIKLGTLAPVGTTYHKALMTMADAWRKESGNAVEVKIFAGGKVGSESEMVGLMMANSLQASMLTAVGLGEIDRAGSGIQLMPMAFRSLEEVSYVSEKLHPIMEEALSKKGFVVLFWTDAGWVRLFSNKPVVGPDDLKRLKLFAWAGNADQVSIMKTAGFNPIPLETADIVPSLQTGLIDAVPMPPFFALASQVDVRAPYMLRINWAPLVGACVVRKESWEKIPAELREKFLKLAQVAGRTTSEAGRRESDESVVAMEKRGLKVTDLKPSDEHDWIVTAEGMYPAISKRIVPTEIFDLTMKLLAEYRAGAAH